MRGDVQNVRFATSFLSGRRQNRAIWVTFKEPVLIVRATAVAVGSHLRFSGQDLDVSTFTILGREDDMFKRKSWVAIIII